MKHFAAAIAQCVSFAYRIVTFCNLQTLSRYVLPTFAPFEKMDQPTHGKNFYLNPRDPKLERRKESFTIRVAFSSTKRTQVSVCVSVGFQFCMQPVDNEWLGYWTDALVWMVMTLRSTV